MTIFRQLSSLFLILICALPASATAGSVAELRARFSQGHRASDEDLEFINAELEKQKTDPVTRFVAGEVLASRGFYDLAKEQFAAADNLNAGFVLTQFKRLIETDRFSPVLMFTYIQDKYPDDPALLFYAARRHLSSPTFSQKEKVRAFATAKKELDKAVTLKNPWPGTYSLLAMLEYNQTQGLNLNQEQMKTSQKLLDSSLELVKRELARNPQDPLALKVRALALVRMGKRTADIRPEIEMALRAIPNDAEMNLLLGRACILKNDYAGAMEPALTGLFWQHGSLTHAESKRQVFEVMHHVKKQDFLKKVDEISMRLAEPGSDGKDVRGTLFRMRVGELFSIFGDREEACRQLIIAYKMHPVYHSSAAFKIGQELASMHLYFHAFPYLDDAVRSNRLFQDDEKYRSYRLRIAKIGLNSDRDLALKLKMLFTKAPGFVTPSVVLDKKVQESIPQPQATPQPAGTDLGK